MCCMCIALRRAGLAQGRTSTGMCAFMHSGCTCIQVETCALERANACIHGCMDTETLATQCPCMNTSLMHCGTCWWTALLLPRCQRMMGRICSAIVMHALMSCTC